MDGAVSEKRDARGREKIGLVDCDIHPLPAKPGEIEAYLPERWRAHARTIGRRGRQGFGRTLMYPRMSPALGLRGDAFPPAGGPAGSDLATMQEQLLDLHDVTYGILAPLVGGGPEERNIDFGAAMATAVNDWQAEVWCDRDPRLKAGIQVTAENVPAAVAEIERRAGDRRFVHVQIPPRALEPLGRQRYRPIFAACAAHDLPVSMHLGGTSGHASTGGGWPSFYFEEHPSYVTNMQAVLTSLVCEGVFEELPTLRVVLVEGGFAWLPAMSWRLDKHWKRLKAEVPFLKRRPSDYVRENVWVTTQPIEEPERRDDMLTTLDWIGVDRVMFSTDYPHWDNDDPRYAFSVPLPADWRRRIFHDNAMSFYRLES
jgi:predicted TIM-barrel fold metal-dependent hydrolase